MIDKGRKLVYAPVINEWIFFCYLYFYFFPESICMDRWIDGLISNYERSIRILNHFFSIVDVAVVAGDGNDVGVVIVLDIVLLDAFACKYEFRSECT